MVQTTERKIDHFAIKVSGKRVIWGDHDEIMIRPTSDLYDGHVWTMNLR